VGPVLSKFFSFVRVFKIIISGVIVVVVVVVHTYFNVWTNVGRVYIYIYIYIYISFPISSDMFGQLSFWSLLQDFTYLRYPVSSRIWNHPW
jgi:hypothetical protein